MEFKKPAVKIAITAILLIAISFSLAIHANSNISFRNFSSIALAANNGDSNGDVNGNTSGGAAPVQGIPEEDTDFILEGGYCQLKDKSGALLSTDPSPCSIHWGLADILTFGIGVLLRVIYVLLRWLLALTLGAFNFFLIPSHFNGYINFLSPDGPSLVTQLWLVFKNLANLGIILGMIFTAIATILQIEKYNWKKTLPRLLLAALLVNFSLVICGIFVDISNYVVNAATTSFNNISLSNLVINCTLCPTVKAFSSIGGTWPLTRAAGLGIVLAALFLFQFVGLLFYVLSRIVTIIICLIVSPLAFLGFAFPGGEKLWTLWRKQFQQAIVILPILCITLVFSLKFINLIAQNLVHNASSFTGIALISYALFIITFAQLVRYVAKSLGIEQIEAGFQLAKGLVNVAAASAGLFTLGRITQSGWYNTVAHKLSAGKDQLGTIPVVGALTRPISNTLYRIKGRVSAAETKREERMLQEISGEPAALTNYIIEARRRGQREAALRALQMKVVAEMDFTVAERAFVYNIPKMFQGLASTRAAYKYNPVLRGPGKTIQETATRYRTSPLTANMNEVIQALIELRGPADAKDFFENTNYGVLKTAHTIKEISDFIESIPASERAGVMSTSPPGPAFSLLGLSLKDWLQQNNKTVYDMVENPSAQQFRAMSAQDRNRAALVRTYWNLP